jgi:hypothetical protein
MPPSATIPNIANTIPPIAKIKLKKGAPLNSLIGIKLAKENYCRRGDKQQYRTYHFKNGQYGHACRSLQITTPLTFL